EIAADVESVFLRQRDVEEDAVERFLRRGLERDFALPGDARVVALALQPIAQREDEALLVFAQQHAALRHDPPPPRGDGRGTPRRRGGACRCRSIRRARSRSAARSRARVPCRVRRCSLFYARTARTCPPLRRSRY